MKSGHCKLNAGKRTAKIMQKYGDGTVFQLQDLIDMGMTTAIAKSQIAMFSRRGMIKTIGKTGKLATYKLTRKTFRREASRVGQVHSSKTVTVPAAKRTAVQTQPGEIFVAINGNKLTVDAPGLIFELTGKIHLKLDT